MFVCLACGNRSLDATKFRDVDAAARALMADVAANPPAGSPQFAELLKLLRAEITAVEAQTIGSRNDALLEAYSGASEAFGNILRFRLLDTEPAGDMVLLQGRNRPIASRNQLPMENRGGGRWVNRKAALELFCEQAQRQLAIAGNLLTAK